LAIPAALVVLLGVLVAACGGSSSSSSSSGESGGSTTTAAADAKSGTDCAGKVGVMVPATGEAAEQGQEQLKWAEFAIERFNAEHGSEITMQEGDTQLDPAQASTIAQQYVSDDEILGVATGGSSSEMEAIGPLFERADMAFVASGATSDELTGKFSTFFRVVPPSSVQGVTDAKFIAETLGAEQAMIIDDQTSYSTELGDEVEEELEALGVKVDRTSVNQKSTDYSSLVSKVPDGGVVFLPWQLAANAQQFGTQLHQAGKEATLFGGDGLFSITDFSIEGSYVSSFAPDIKSIPADAELVTEYEAKYGDFGTYGPPAYAATEAVLEGIQAGCEAGGASRDQVAEAVAATEMKESILGRPLSFEEGNPVGAEFFIFKVENGEFVAADA
jgi:branched-chain amino acid transport system substrate-binding protein